MLPRAKTKARIGLSLTLDHSWHLEPVSQKPGHRLSVSLRPVPAFRAARLLDFSDLPRDNHSAPPAALLSIRDPRCMEHNCGPWEVRVKLEKPGPPTQEAGQRPPRPRPRASYLRQQLGCRRPAPAGLHRGQNAQGCPGAEFLVWPFSLKAAPPLQSTERRPAP